MIGLLLAMVFGALAPVETVVAPRASSPLTIDARADEPAWTEAEWASEFVDITGDPDLKPTLKTRVKLLWDDDYLYLYAELEETNVVAHLTERDAIIWKENDFEVFIDPDGDGENYFEFEWNAANTLFDLFLTRPYSDPRGTFVLHDWNCAGVRSATRIEGTLNDSSDVDRLWALEAAIPAKALANGFTMPFAANRRLKIGFSRVEWLNPEKECNWTLGATGKVDMHIPSRWATVTLAPRVPVLVWYRWDAEKESEASLAARFRAWAETGVSEVAVSVGSFDVERHRTAARLAKASSLVYHAWVTSLLKADAPREWYTVNPFGESAADETARAYVTYYATLDPAHPEVRDYLVAQATALAEIDALDYVHLDYIRYADYILPKALWPKYGVSGAEPKADACYCARCQAAFQATGGELTWDQFREENLTTLVNAVAEAVRGKGKRVSAAVFPGPETYARPMVRQDWKRWNVDLLVPMNYHVFYDADLNWIGRMVREEVSAVNARVPIYSGLKLKPRGDVCPREDGFVDPESLGLTADELSEARKLSLKNGAHGLALFGVE